MPKRDEKSVNVGQSEDGNTVVYLAVDKKWTTWVLVLLALMMVIIGVLSYILWASYTESKLEIKELQRQINEKK